AMASTDKGKFVVLFTSGNFVFFKHKNDKGIYCPKSILNSSRQVLKDDIYELVTDNVQQQHRRQYPDMPEAAVLIATKAKFLKTPRIIHGVGTMKKVSVDGEYGFVEYQDGKSMITAFVTRITVKPPIEKGGMHKFFSTGCKVRFVAKEQPPSGMFNIEWRCVTATDMKHEISETNFEKVTPVSATVPAARPVVPASPAPRAPPTAAAAAPSAATTAAAAAALPPGLPMAATQSNGGVSASSSSSSVVNGVSYSARASQQLPPMPEAVASAAHRAVGDGRRSSPVEVDESLPATCPVPRVFRLSDEEKIDEWGYSSSSSSLRSSRISSWPSSDGSLLPLQLRSANFPSLSEGALSAGALAQAVYDVWPHYKKDEERSLEAFEAELSQLSHVASALHGGDPHVCPIYFASRVS
ncbi:hypothetical protein PMAYCL1PPCAC_14393, partial [Pristionchus mayeri]